MVTLNLRIHRKFGKKRLMLLTTAVLLSLSSISVNAANSIVNVVRPSDDSSNIATEDSLTATNGFVDSVGTSIVPDSNIVSLGTKSNVNISQSTAIGTQAVSIGDANTDLGNTAIGMGAAANTQGSDKVVAVTTPNDYDGYATALGYNSSATKTGAVALGSLSQASGGGAVAAGISALASGDVSTALGGDTAATALATVAVGFGSEATAMGALAAGGYSTVAKGSMSIAVGTMAKANKDGSMAIGSKSSADNDNSVALGTSSATSAANTAATEQYYTLKDGTKTATFAGLASTTNGTVSVGASGAERQIQNVAAGNVTSTSTDAINGSQLYQVATTLATTLATNEKHVTPGTYTVNGSTGSVTMTESDGNGKALADSDVTITIPYVKSNNAVSSTAAVASGAESSALGYQSQATGKQSVAVGNTAKATATDTTAVGYNAQAIYNNSTVLGANSSVTDPRGGIAVGYNAKATAKPKAVYTTIAVGNNAVAGDSTCYGGNIAIGESATAKREATVAIGMNATSTSGGGVALGYVATAGKNGVGIGDTALGGNTKATGNSSTAIGSWAESSGINSISLSGFYDETDAAGVVQRLHTVASGAKAIAIGAKSTASGEESITLGFNNVASGKQSETIGADNTIVSDTSFAVGNSNTTISGQSDNFILGNNVNIGAYSHAVALGDNTTIGAAVGTASYTIDSTTYNFAGTNPYGVVSVGADSEERELTNVAAGQISNTSTDAINGSQLFGVITEVEKGITYAADKGTHNSKLGTILTIAGGNGTTGSYSTTNVRTDVTTDTTNGNGVITIKMSDTPIFTSAVIGGVNISGGKITNLTAGTADTDAVNVSQLKTVKNNGITNITSTTNQTTGGATVTYTKGDNTTGTIGTFSTTDYQLVANPNATSGAYSVANNKVDLTVQDAINGVTKTVTIDNIASKSELNDVAKTAAAHSSVTAADGNIVVDSTSKNADGGTDYKLKLSDDVNVNKTVTIGTNTETKVKVDGTTGTITTGAVSVNGGMTNTVTGLSNTDWNEGNPTGYLVNRAATEGELMGAVVSAVDQAKGSDVHVQKGDYTNTNGTITMDLVKGDENSTTTTGATVVLKDIAKSSDVGDVTTINTTNKTEVANPTTVVDNINNIYSKVNNGWDAQIDGTTVNNVTPTNNKMNFETGDNIILSNDNGAIKIATSKNITVDTIKVGDTVTINNNGIDAGGTKVTNVKDGDVSQGSTDAVNGGQLYAAEANTSNIFMQLGNAVNQLGDRVNKVGAGSAALAALHPLDFDPDDKWDFAAGYGHYKGEGAAAIGAFYRPNEDTMFSLGASLGNGETMWNTGVSMKLGQGNHVSTSRVAMAKQMNDMHQYMMAMDKRLGAVEAQNKGLLAVLDMYKTKEFPDVPTNHWAYEAMAKLAGNGIIEGYPDGTFKGNHAMTRYEFATILYRALTKGGSVDSKLIQEFKPELERIRVDTVSRDSEIQRVRVIPGRG